jgi:1,4-dihydroxy-2-naphthoate octaprenyltransferase
MLKLMRLARMQFLTASLALYALGALWAILLGAPFSLSRILLGYLIILPGHMSVSFSNDYFDVEADRNGNPALFSGGSGMLVSHPELRKPALWIAIMLNVCSMSMGWLFLTVFLYSYWFLGFVFLGIMLGWFYSAPPIRLAYRGLGEFSTAFTAGCLLPGMGYLVMKGYLNKIGLLFTMPLLLYGLAFILVVEIPDVEMDRLGRKHTWVVRKGRSFGYTSVGLLFLAATVFFYVFPWLYTQPIPVDFHVLSLFSLVPLGAGIIGMVKKPKSQEAATRIVNWIVITLAIFFIFTDGYFVYLSMKI